jgi:L-glyceraldehyde 3-phosphate reductase
MASTCWCRTCRAGSKILPRVWFRNCSGVALRRHSLPPRRQRSGLVLPSHLARALAQLRRQHADRRTQRKLLRTAFDLGINHFDLANNYGPPYGSAETNFGRLLREDFKAYRDELIISSKAGWDMWPGPTARAAARANTCSPASTRACSAWGWTTSTSSIRTASIRTRRWKKPPPRWRRPCSRARRCTSASRRTPAGKTREIAALLREWKVPLLIHQPAYNLFNRWIEKDLLDATDELGAGVIAFTPLAQGLLTDKYLKGIPADARINRPGGGSLKQEHLSDANIEHVRALNEIAKRRGQSLAQLALTWTLRDPRVTSALIGASRPEQIVDNVGALKNLSFSAEELAEIDRFAQEGGINLWEKPSTAE